MPAAGMILVRMAMVALTALATFYFVFWLPCSVILPTGTPLWIPLVLSLCSAALAGRFVWGRTRSVPSGVVTCIGMGALVTGAIGFIGGFFGPIIFAPDANQGPLLGIFITGPLGFMLGAAGGAIYWYTHGRTRV